MNSELTCNDLPLAPKELLYLNGRAHGLTNKEIAREYGVSYRTVEGAMQRVLYKLHARRVTEAVFKATSEGLLFSFFALAVFVTAFQVTSDQPYRIRASRGRQTTSLRVRNNRSGKVSDV
jgi:DNA-binding CsgD family transcriptional regulator